MSWFGDVLGFEGFNAKGMLKQIKDNPARLLYGSADPFSTKVWNGILGTNDKPIVDQMGGATGDRYRDAEAAGIDTTAGKGVHNIAHVIAAAQAGGYGLGSLGVGGGASAGTGSLGGGAEAGAGAGSGGGMFSGLFGGGGAGGSGGAGGAAAGGSNWGQLIQAGAKGFGQGGGGNDAALRRQEQIAEQLRRTYEEQQRAAQALPGWVNMNGG